MIVILEEQRRSAACMRAFVRWRGGGGDGDGVVNVMQKSAKKYKKVIDNTILICYTYNIRYE